MHHLSATWIPPCRHAAPRGRLPCNNNDEGDRYVSKPAGHCAMVCVAQAFSFASLANESVSFRLFILKLVIVT
jgi:hypothetical protein